LKTFYSFWACGYQTVKAIDDFDKAIKIRAVNRAEITGPARPAIFFVRPGQESMYYKFYKMSYQYFTNFIVS
jgi:hypothetical protein